MSEEEHEVDKNVLLLISSRPEGLEGGTGSMVEIEVARSRRRWE